MVYNLFFGESKQHDECDKKAVKEMLAKAYRNELRTLNLVHKNLGFHLNGIQHRVEDGSQVDPAKSGAILTTSQHLFVRSIAISLWKPTPCTM